MQEEYSLLKQENYQLKNEISELKNAFDLNRDILKIISEESKCSQPRIQMLYQIINRLTSINNQIMINTAELIHEKNTFKIQKQFIKRQNELLKERIDEMLQKQYVMNKTNKINQLSIYFTNKINDLENEMKVLEEQRIIKQHQIQFLNKKIEYYQGQSKKISLIPTIDKNNPAKKFIEPPPSSLVPPLQQHVRKYSSNKEIKLEFKHGILTRQLSRLKIYTQQLEYRLLTLIKVHELEDQIKKKDVQSLKKQHRKCLQQSYSDEITEVRLLKFALNNLVKQQKQGSDLMFSVTNRNFCKVQHNNLLKNSHKNRNQNRHKSVQKYDKIKMKSIIIKIDEDSSEEQKQQQ